MQQKGNKEVCESKSNKRGAHQNHVVQNERLHPLPRYTYTVSSTNRPQFTVRVPLLHVRHGYSARMSYLRWGLSPALVIDTLLQYHLATLRLIPSLRTLFRD